MTRVILLLLSFCCGVAHAQQIATPLVVNVRDFGAVGNDVHDDTAAINAALAFVKANYSGGPSGGYYAQLVFPAAVAYKITSALNFTGFAGLSFDIEGGGATIDCQATNAICLDALGSRWLRLHNLTIIGSATNTPKIGIQIGRIASNINADKHAFDAVTVSGSFTLTPLYNFASETDVFTALKLYNSYSNSGAYCLIQDGMNHFNAQSTFVSETAPVDVPQSFNENTFVTLDCERSGSGNGIWAGNTARLKFIGGYTAVAAGYGAVLYQAGNGSYNFLMDWDMHFEATGLTDVFFLTGSQTEPILDGFSYRDQGPFNSDAIFKTDTNITGAIVRNANFQIGYYNTNFFSGTQASLWQISGDYWSQAIPPDIGNVLTWNGRIFAGQNMTFAEYGQFAFLSAQYPDNTIVGGGPRGSQTVDFQMSRGGAQQVASGFGAVISGGWNNQADGTFSVVPGGNGASANGRTGANCFSSSFNKQGGDTQECTMTLQGTVSSSSGSLTADGSANSSVNCVNILPGTAFNVRMAIHARDNTTNGTDYDWYLPTGMLTQDGSAGTTAWAAGTPVILTRGTTTGAAVSVTADITNGCLNVTFTRPSASTDTWHVIGRVETTEVK